METTDNMLNTQLELENMAQAAGINRYKNALNIRGHGNTQPGQRLLAPHTEVLTSTIQAWFSTFEGKVGRKAGNYTRIQHLQPAALAYLTVNTVMQTIAGVTKVTVLARKIGQAVESHNAWLQLIENHGGLAFKVGEQLKGVGNERHRKFVTRHVTSNVAGIAKWSEAEAIGIGRTLLELLVGCSSLIEMTKVRRKDSIITPSASTLDFLNAGHDRCEALSPANQPMVCPPKPWTNPWDGGYLINRNPLVRAVTDTAMSEVDSADMPGVYRALNAMQDTAYSVNQGVLDVLNKVWLDGGGFAGIPRADNIEVPGLLPEDASQEQRDSNRDTRREVNEDNVVTTSKRLSLMRTVALANQFKHYDAIHFPHNLDWRGRVYPISTDLQPQGDDFAKSLLQFSEGREIGEEGKLWLMIHVANLFGVDKVSMDDRIVWVTENLNSIIDSAINPLDGDQFWCIDPNDPVNKETGEVKFRSKPWQILAGCIELMRAEYQGPSYKSKLIIAMDGSCNGLQNLSAMLRDEVGGAAVNLTPADKPNDIYTQVQEAVQLKVDAAPGGTEFDWWSTRPVSRDLVKRAVMTKPYGVTDRGMADQIAHLMRKPGSEYHSADKKERYVLSTWITQYINDAIGEIVVASASVMDWMKDITKVIAATGVPLRWTTPLGFPVLQDYRRMASTVAKVWLYGQRLRYNLGHKTDAIDVRRQAGGTSPNVVHSLDATHMMMSVNAGLDEGMDSFAMIHDSFGAHAACIGEFNIILREQFVAIYREDVLLELESQFKAQAPGAEFPVLPTLGTLDIEDVLGSMYFFA